MRTTTGSLIGTLIFHLALLGCATTLSAAEKGLLAGAAKRSIVPPFPTHMGGFNDRLQSFEGVHDEIFVRAVVLDDGATRLIVIGSDLMAIDAELVALAREKISAATQIPAGNILISCAHNHSAPSYYQKNKPGEADAEPSLKQFLAKQFAEAAVEAYQQRVPARAGFHAGRLVGLTRNRQQKNNDMIDPQVGVVRVEEREGRKTIATLFNFTGHPVVIGSKNLLLSGEFPGAASRTVEGVLGGIAIFTQGACGDITVNRTGDPFQEIERIGRTIAGEVIKASGFISCTESLPLQAASRTVQLAARPVVPLAEAESALKRGTEALEEAKKKGLAPAAIQSIEDRNRVLEIAVKRAEILAKEPSKREERLTAEVQVMQIGEVILVAIPGELFVEYALEMRSRVLQDSGKSMCLIGYANGYLGYIVTPRAMETGGYEASITRLDVQGGRVLTETAIDLVRGLNIK
ncbi:MAG: neutral/alkaline non-lysosomal ceramidase N-terminal domain-containing protein [Planctomycetaceae bacterium]